MVGAETGWGGHHLQPISVARRNHCGFRGLVLGSHKRTIHSKVSACSGRNQQRSRSPLPCPLNPFLKPSTLESIMNARMYCAILSTLDLTSPAQPAEQPESPAHSVSGRGPHHRNWERAEYELTPAGRELPRKVSYSELATGLNYQNELGEWIESKEEIELLPNGAGAVARQGQHKVFFAPDVSAAEVVDLEMPNRQRLRSRIFGLSYYDTSSEEAVLIGAIQSAEEPGKAIGGLRCPRFYHAPFPPNRGMPLYRLPLWYWQCNRTDQCRFVHAAFGWNCIGLPAGSAGSCLSVPVSKARHWIGEKGFNHCQRIWLAGRSRRQKRRRRPATWFRWHSRSSMLP